MFKRRRKTTTVPKEKVQLFYKDIPCDSSEEVDAFQWCEALKGIGIIKEFKRVESLQLFGGLYNTYTVKKELKTKTKTIEKTETILSSSVYTPDIEIEWCMEHPLIPKITWVKTDNKVKNDKFYLHADNKSYLEVKSHFDFGNMTRLWKTNQRYLYDKHKIFVDLFIPQEMFQKTFTPTMCMYDKRGKLKNYKTEYKLKSLKEWINNLEN